jgi:hypothetical protein
VCSTVLSDDDVWLTRTDAAHQLSGATCSTVCLPCAADSTDDPQSPLSVLGLVGFFFTRWPLRGPPLHGMGGNASSWVTLRTFRGVSDLRAERPPGTVWNAQIGMKSHTLQDWRSAVSWLWDYGR